MASRNVVLDGVLISGGSSALTQSFENGLDNINWSNVAMSGAVGGMTANIGGSIAQKLEAPLSNIYSSN